MSAHPIRALALAEFAAHLDFEMVHEPVIDRIGALHSDRFVSARAGKGSRTFKCVTRFAKAVSGDYNHGQIQEVLIDHSRASSGASSDFAAVVNAAASHVVEQDNLHNGLVLHPATAIFPAGLELAQVSGTSGRGNLAAAVAGYEVGIRVGEFLSRAHKALEPHDIARVMAHVHQGAIDLLAAFVDRQTVRQANFSMGTVLGMIACRGRAGVTDFQHGLPTRTPRRPMNEAIWCSRTKSTGHTQNAGSVR